MPNYWLGIMAVALAVALAAWIGLVFMADKQQSRPPQETVLKREVIGGMFAAHKGGRQVMPDPEESIVHDDWVDPQVVPAVPGAATGVPRAASGAPGQAAGLPEQAARIPEQAARIPQQAARVPGQARPEAAEQAEQAGQAGQAGPAEPSVPAQRAEPAPEQAQASGDHP